MAKKFKKLLRFWILLLATTFSNVVNSQTIKSMDEQLADLRKLEIKGNSKTNYNEAQKLHGLYYDYNPGLVIKGSELKNTEISNPIVLDLDVIDVSGLYLRNPEFATIEMIRFSVKSKEDAIALNLEKLVGFNSLKYIVFQCEFNCDYDYVKSRMLSGNPLQKISVIYLVSIPE